MIENLIFPIDHIILTIGSIVVVLCFWKGVISSILGLLTWIGSILVTIYFYKTLSEFINKQLLNFELLKNYEQITNLIAILISIPIVFLFTLFILKKIKKMISLDLDNQILGKIIDKMFGFLFGFVFNYLIFSTIIYGISNFEYLNSLNNFLFENSFLLNELNKINNNFINLILFKDSVSVS